MKVTFQTYLLFLVLLNASDFAHAQSTAFTYNGRLTDKGLPVSGQYEMRFTLFDSAGGNVVIGGPLPPSMVEVVSGLFTARIDFGADKFTGPPRWLEVAVHPANAPSFTVLTPRQEVTSSPHAIRAQTAGTAASVANGTVTAAQLNTAGVAPAAGQFLSYNNGSFVWTDPAAPAGEIWSRNGTTAYYATGGVSIGTNNVTAGVRFEVNGPARIAAGGNGGALSIGTPNGESGLGVVGVNRFDLRFNGSTLKLVAGPGTGPPPAENGIAIDTTGRVGIGTTNRFPGYALDVKGAAVIQSGGSGGGVIAFGTPSTETGMTINSLAGSGDFRRADVRFDGSTLKLVATGTAGPPPAENGVAINTGGNVGIGTTLPVAKLHAEATQVGTAVYGNAPRPIGRGVHGNAPGTAGVGVYGQSAVGTAVYADGNAGQARDKGGFVKAMAYINPFLPADQYVVRCYNSQVVGAPTTTAPCGITVTRSDSGDYLIDFGFRIDDRFFSVTTLTGGAVANVTPINATAVRMFVLQFNSVKDLYSQVDSIFHIIVF